MESGLGQSLFLAVTPSSVQVEWSSSLGSHSFEVHSCEKFRRIDRFGGWCRTDIPWGKTHSLQVTLCLVSEEWPRVGNGPSSEIRNNPSSLVEKNGADSLLLIFYVEGRHSFRPHRCEWKIGPNDYYWCYILRADILSDLTDMSERLAQMIIVDILYWGQTRFQISQT